MLRRFDVDTSKVPLSEPMSGESWQISQRPMAAFKMLAGASSRILAGCQVRSTRAKRSGAKHAVKDLKSWISSSSEGGVIRCDVLEETCKKMLRDQEHPKHAIKDDEDFTSTQIPPSESDTIDMTEDEGPWDATDSAFRDELFRVGCFLFTQFYKERTKEVRLAYVCGYRDALAYAVSWAKTRCSPGLYSVPAVALAEMLSSIQITANAHLRGAIIPLAAAQSSVESFGDARANSGVPRMELSGEFGGASAAGALGGAFFGGDHTQSRDVGGAAREASDVLGSLNLGVSAEGILRHEGPPSTAPSSATRTPRSTRASVNGGSQMSLNRAGGLASSAGYAEGGRCRRRRLEDDDDYHCGFNGTTSRRGHATESDALSHWISGCKREYLGDTQRSDISVDGTDRSTKRHRTQYQQNVASFVHPQHQGYAAFS
eukprot:m.328526 g.328526  ORF g.328526 m.328526 type:complete len:430 (+) comp20430_c0_seq1:188-1477(+)